MIKIQLLSKVFPTMSTRDHEPLSSWNPSNLPYEICSIIFCISHADFHRQDVSVGESPVEILISHVCQHWRNVAISVPSLWSFFRHEIAHMTCESKERLQTYLERSKPCPIDLLFRFKARTWSAHHGTLLEIATGHVDRWRSFRLDVPNSTYVMLHMQHCLRHLTAPHLQHLSIRAADYLGNTEMPMQRTSSSPSIFLGGTPNLSVLLIDGHDFHPSLRTVLTLFVERRQENIYAIPREMFPTLSTLTNLSINDNPYRVSDFRMAHSRVELKHLRHLRINHAWPIRFILQLIHAPNLETLMLNSVNGSFWPVADYEAIDPEVFPVLRSLFLSHYELTRSFWRKLCATCSSVTHITIFHLQSSDYSENAEPLSVVEDFRLPNLRLLSLSSNSAQSRVSFSNLTQLGSTPQYPMFRVRLGPTLFKEWKAGLSHTMAETWVEQWAGEEKPSWPPNTDLLFCSDYF
jgi:hypothetical protein